MHRRNLLACHRSRWAQARAYSSPIQRALSRSQGPTLGSTTESVGLSDMHYITLGSIQLWDDQEAHLTPRTPLKRNKSMWRRRRSFWRFQPMLEIERPKTMWSAHRPDRKFNKNRTCQPEGEHRPHREVPPEPWGCHSVVAVASHHTRVQHTYVARTSRYASRGYTLMGLSPHAATQAPCTALRCSILQLSSDKRAQTKQHRQGSKSSAFSWKNQV